MSDKKSFHFTKTLYLQKRRNVFTLVRQINFAYILSFMVLSVVTHGWQKLPIIMILSNGSCGHHFFYIKTRSSAEHRKIAIRERSKRFSTVFTRRLAFLLSYVRHGTRRNKVIFPFVQLNFTWVVDKTECTNYSHTLHCYFGDSSLISRQLSIHKFFRCNGSCKL